MVHAEDPACLVGAPAGGSRAHGDWLASRPAQAERSAVAMLVRLMEEWPTPVHVVHLSSATTLPLIEDARARGLPLTVETCPHYLTFASDEIPDGATEFKCAPPIRRATEREALWQALLDGAIDLVASDHSPCPPTMKARRRRLLRRVGRHRVAAARARRRCGAARARVAPAWSASPSGCAPRRRGSRGSPTARARSRRATTPTSSMWDPDASFVVDPAALHHRHPVTPYAGRTLFGVVKQTYVDGRLVG